MAKFVLRPTFRFADLAKWTDESKMRALGVELAVRVQNRTQSGLDENGARFAPYSKRYAAWKGNPRVNLTLSGKMLDGFDVLKVTRNSVTLGWADRTLEARAEAHQYGYGSLPVRPFLGVPQTWITDIVRKLKAGIK